MNQEPLTPSSSINPIDEELAYLRDLRSRSIVMQGRELRIIVGDQSDSKNKQKLATKFDQSLKKIHEQAKTLTSHPHAQETEKAALLNEFDKVRHKFLQKVSNDSEALKFFKEQRKALKNELGWAARNPLTERPRMLADALERRVSVRDQAAFASRLSRSEESFIDEQLAASPSQQQTALHFDMLRSNQLKFIQTVKETGKPMLANGVQIYDIDGLDYKFIGVAGGLHCVESDYKGCLAGKWPYVCTSVIDKDHCFFQEWSSYVYQILDIPIECYVHTSHIDLKTPYASSGIQPEWYSAIKRAQVFADQAETAYLRFIEMENARRLEENVKRNRAGLPDIPPLPINTYFDQAILLHRQAEDWIKLLEEYKVSLPDLPKRCVEELIKLLSDPKDRTDINYIHLALSEVLANVPIRPANLQHIKELIVGLHAIEAAHPEMRTPFWENDPVAINRAGSHLNVLLMHYGSADLSNAEDRKAQFLRLFKADDPSGHYDILGELIKIDQILKRLPSEMTSSQGRFRTRVNRMMEPQTILSEARTIEHNEINIDTTKGKVRPLALVVSKSLLNSSRPDDQEQLKAMLKFAKKKNILIMIRTNPDPDAGKR